MKKILIFSIGLFLFTAFFGLDAQAESIVPDGVQHVDSYAVDININSDSSLNVTENIRYNYADKSETGFTRYIPLSYRDLAGTKFSVTISDLSISDENGKSYLFTQSKIKDNNKPYLKIEIGDVNYPVSGIPTYIMRYTVSGAIKYTFNHDSLFWNITGDKWPVYITQPEVKISLPQKTDSTKIVKDCFIGISEATVKCSDQLNSKKDIVAYYKYKGVVAGEGMTINLEFPKGIVQKATLQKKYWTTLLANQQFLGLSVLIITLFLIGLLLCLLYFKKIVGFFSRKKWLTLWLGLKKKIKFYHTKHLGDKSRKWRITAYIIFTLFLFFSGIIGWKIENTLNKISTKGDAVNSIVHAAFNNQGQLKGEDDDRINILLLGMRGANSQGGGLNTDTIMVASIKPKANKISLISIPRDLWVIDPEKETQSKLNAVYVYGEEKGSGQGISDMETMIGDITGLPIHYTAVISTNGFAQLVDTLGGVDIDLPVPFYETAQFNDVKVCDSDTYTLPTGEFQDKKDDNGKIVAHYPLCKNNNPECGGDFRLPAGKSTLDGEKALCFIRSRYLTNDFERSKRQQLVLQQLKQKLASFGLGDFGKINPLLDNLGENVRTDLQLWEIKRLFDLSTTMNNPKIYQKVLEDSKEGLLYSPDKTPETGYILLPRGDNYDKIRNLFQNIFEKNN